jgi:hypothetical protein
MVILKLAEPITLFTDGIIAIQCFYYAIRLWQKNTTSKNVNLLKLGVIDFIFISGFSVFGAISHFTSNDNVFGLSWPFALILGGCALCIFQILLTELNFTSLFRKGTSNSFHRVIYLVTILILMIFIILNLTTRWNFNYFSGYFVLDCAYFFILVGIQRSQKKKERFEGFNRVLLYYFFWVLLLGIIQLLGKIFLWQFVFGENSKYLLQLGNEIAHICLLYANFILYRGIQKHFFNLEKRRENTETHD